MQLIREIWLLVDSSGFGGIESHLLQLASGLTQKGLSVRVVLLKSYGPHPLKQSLSERGVELGIAGGFFGLVRLLRESRPALLHTHGYKAGITGRTLGRLFGVKTVSTFHAGEIPKGKVALYDYIDRVSAGLAHHAYAVSPQVASRLRGPSEVIENFIDTQCIKPSNGKNIAFVGRLSHEKGPDRFMDVGKTIREAEFHLYGSGILEEELRNLSTENMVFHGQKNSMEEAWQQIDILLITSRFEGLPMAAIEAMARGIPVIAFNVGALSTLIDHNINGWLVEPGDTQGIVSQVRAWLSCSHSHKCKVRQQAIKKITTHFSCDAIVPKYIAQYQRLVDQPLVVHA